ncbi:hypothetical protein [Brevibacillus borstelensis]|uniref:hypothetical protein n=1 Tax=Brevibacillus borstelensis TaxID=45462 RepID=UPI000469D363|nr:hypothetical protein [Brevibacillus borstelensis]MCC0567479.1 hypothetical protein [Brevibacillus borstelensis]MCM3473649.1 hypothetical protein [Brevibacillus borstelensis]MCM3561911.1 hypothetical protein [Brevibacillus borstelensis]MCM3594018.1 hypothetical protein [Brevibacillus borstelensis]MED1853569.1 hypothetical protein [Brevibacillus borstelensis]
MATFEELALSYAHRLMRASNKFDEARQIAFEIDRLSIAQKPIPTAAKIQLIKQIEFFLRSRGMGGNYHFRDSDNAQYIDLVSYIMSTLKGDK